MQPKAESYLKRNVMTLILIVINVVVFVVCSTLADISYSETMLRFGGLFYPYVMAGDWYRLLTSMFLHFDGVHLIRNMLSLFALGSIIEPAFGKIRYTVIYLLSGIGAGITSVLYHFYTGRYVVSAGSSGAVFGLAGALIALGLFNKAEEYGISSGRVIPAIILSVILSTSSNTDVSAHLGGLFTGLIIAVIMILIRRHDNRSSTGQL